MSGSTLNPGTHEMDSSISSRQPPLQRLESRGCKAKMSPALNFNPATKIFSFVKIKMQISKLLPYFYVKKKIKSRLPWPGRCQVTMPRHGPSPVMNGAPSPAGSSPRTGAAATPHSPRALQRVCHETAQRASCKGQGEISGSVRPTLAWLGGCWHGTSEVHRAFVVQQ